jgi:tetratricopeptide (TPR) repeat protein
MPRASRAARPARAGSDSRRRDLAAVAAIVTVAAIAYGNTFRNPFVFDDLPRIARDPTLRRLWPPWPIVDHTSRPLVQLSFAVDFAISRLETWSYHLTNLLIHVAAGIALFALVRWTLARSAPCARYRDAAFGIALASALLWVAHPLTTEAVTYLVQRGEALASLFYLLTLYALARGSEGVARETASNRGRAKRWRIAAVIFCALGMMSKPVMVTAPLVVLLYDRVFLSRSFADLWRARGRLHVALFATILVLPALLARAPMDWRYSSGSAAEAGAISPATYAMTQPGVVAHYLRLAFWPHPLVLDYSWPLVRGAGDALLPGLVILALLAITLVLLVRGNPLGFLGVACFAILAPTSSFFPVLDAAFEHRMYLSLAAVIVLVVIAGYEGLRAARAPRPVAIGLVAITLVACGWRTRARNHDYRSAVAIWTDNVAHRPDNLRARVNLAYALAGDREFTRGLAAAEEVLARDPDYPWAHLAAGYFLTKLGRLDEAAPHLEHAVQRLPASAEAHYLLGSVLLYRGQAGAAQHELEQAVRLEPWRAEAQNNLGMALNQVERWETAIPHLEQAITLRPEYANAHFNLGVSLAATGDLARARLEFETTLTLDPAHAHAKEALETLARQGAP